MLRNSQSRQIDQGKERSRKRVSLPAAKPKHKAGVTTCAKARVDTRPLKCSLFLAKDDRVFDAVVLKQELHGKRGRWVDGGGHVASHTTNANAPDTEYRLGLGTRHTKQMKLLQRHETV